ncbi:TetR/AcrR family transcriptional regulator [Nocardia asiatica]|uniref:TetR/AcrR family transcriptional regulator n=1 Tax=Nocardia asiatica TaxID=209252 RepID=UPI0005C15202|nr:TetR/AcrR family transcriptional regulator [Nocardia asiatica]
MVLNAREAAVQDASDALRVLAAAERLFNDRGIQAVGMDAIRDAADVPLKRLYKHFPSKADLVRAVLGQRDCEVRAAIAQFVDAHGHTPRERVLAVFDFLFEWFAEPGFRGCLFINTVGELGGTVDDVGRIARQHKLAVRDYLADLLADCSVSEALADQLLIIANGAMVTAAMHDDPQAARRARDAAEVLLSAAERHGE